MKSSILSIGKMTSICHPSLDSSKRLSLLRKRKLLQIQASIMIKIFKKIKKQKRKMKMKWKSKSNISRVSTTKSIKEFRKKLYN